MQPIQEIIATYFSAWNDPTLDGCARLLAQCCAPDIAYVDPRYTCRGVAELTTRINTARVQLPSSRVNVTSALDGYDDTYRYTWIFDAVSSPLRIPGIDVVRRDGEGRIATLVSFFGALETIAEGAPLRMQPRWGA